MILIVDDDEHLLGLLEVILVKEGYAVLKARNGRDAVDLALRNSPEVITMDVAMAQLDGFEAARIIKANPETKDIPIVFITSMDDIESQKKAKQLGGDDFLPKPFNPIEVAKKIRALVEKRADIDT